MTKISSLRYIILSKILCACYFDEFSRQLYSVSFYSNTNIFFVYLTLKSITQGRRSCFQLHNLRQNFFLKLIINSIKIYTLNIQECVLPLYFVLLEEKNDLFVSNAKQICSFRPMNYFAACIKRKFVELRRSCIISIIFYFLCIKKSITNQN